MTSGSIFGVFEAEESCVPDFDADDEGVVADKCVASACRPGSNLKAAGYCMYSSSTILMLTLGDGVYGFTMDPSVGEFVMSHERVTVPERGRIYSFNEGNYEGWDEGVRRYVDALKKGGPDENGKPYSARYIGRRGGDFHRTCSTVELRRSRRRRSTRTGACGCSPSARADGVHRGAVRGEGEHGAGEGAGRNAGGDAPEVALLRRVREGGGVPGGRPRSRVTRRRAPSETTDARAESESNAAHTPSHITVPSHGLVNSNPHASKSLSSSSSSIWPSESSDASSSPGASASSSSESSESTTASAAPPPPPPA